jgi:hypothetical protein
VTCPPVSPGPLRPTLIESLDRLDVEIQRSKALLTELVDLTERTHSAIDLYWRRCHEWRAVRIDVAHERTMRSDKFRARILCHALTRRSSHVSKANAGIDR